MIYIMFKISQGADLKKKIENRMQDFTHFVVLHHKTTGA